MPINNPNRFWDLIKFFFTDTINIFRVVGRAFRKYRTAAGRAISQGIAGIEHQVKRQKHERTGEAYSIGGIFEGDRQLEVLDHCKLFHVDLVFLNAKNFQISLHRRHEWGRSANEEIFTAGFADEIFHRCRGDAFIEDSVRHGHIGPFGREKHRAEVFVDRF